MCARLGIRQAYSQAYRPQANGKAEVAGKTLISLLRKLHTEEQLNWVEALPRVLQIYHDTPGESGVSPFQFMFGRDRNLAGSPYVEPRECESAFKFFKRQEAMDIQISQRMNVLHKKEESRVNSKLSDPMSFQPGDRVWVLRPKGSFVSKFDTWWVGPALVQSRKGKMSYTVRVSEGAVQHVHRDQLKLVEGGALTGTSIPLYYHTKNYHPMGTDVNEWNVEQIIRHRMRGKVCWNS